jgi:gliding motility-associated-like protein
MIRIHTLLFLLLTNLSILRAATFTVTSTVDNNLPGSLRSAILLANSTPGANTIVFTTSGTINLTSTLPPLTNPVTIDATTAPGWAAGAPVIEINCGGTFGPALQINGTGGGSVIKSLVLNRSSSWGIFMANSNGNTISGCFIGTDMTGTIARPNTFHGIDLTGSSNNTIGGLTLADRNVISGNTQSGIMVEALSTNNTISGNFIGTNAAGTAALGNGQNGIQVDNSSGNILGSSALAGKNVISGNKESGIKITSNSNGNTIKGNYAGTDFNGTTAISNLLNGILVTGSSNNTIGGATVNERNVISGNVQYGIILDNNSNGTAIQNNYIGVDKNGNTALGNGRTPFTVNGTASTNDGIFITNLSKNSTILDNVISGNGTRVGFFPSPYVVDFSTGNYKGKGCGIRVESNSDNTTIRGNEIGVGADGVTPIGNAENGISSAFTNNLIIGGSTPSQRNIIGNHGFHAINLYSCTNFNIKGNYIGTDVSGTLDLGNQDSGIQMHVCTTGIIGGTGANDGNILVNSKEEYGIRIQDSKSITVQGNSIGTTANGNTKMGNAIGGIYLVDYGSGTTNNIIGTAGNNPGPGEPNSIAFNGGPGVIVENAGGTSAKFNSIKGNAIYCNTGISISLLAGANEGLAAPVITSAGPGTITGSGVVPFAIVNIYRTGRTGTGCNCGSDIYIASVTADGAGNWSYVHGLDAITASTLTTTQTNLAVPVPSTSQFSICCVPPKITLQPVNKSLCPGSNTTFTTNASGTNPINYKWQIKAPGAVSFTDISNNTIYSGSSSSTLSVSGVTLAMDQTKYRAVAYGCYPADTSLPATLTVNPAPNLILVNTSICSPGTVDLTASPAVWKDANATVGTNTYFSDAAGTIALANPNAVNTSGTYYIKRTTNSVPACTDIKPVVVTINPLPTASVTKTDLSCSGANNGTATVVAANGTAPYSYSWNSSPVQTTATATALPAGSYTVTVTDANACKNTGSATIASPAVLTAAASATNVSCNASSDGTATVSPSGGTGPYTYSWNTSPVQTTASISALPAGTYTVTVKDANNCSITASATVGAPLTLSASATATNITCGGTNGSVTASASGGTAPYSYSWNTSPVQTTATASGLGAGTYTVTVTDAKACIKTTSATVTSASGLTASVTTVNTKCNTSADGSATATVSGGTGPYSYSWNTSPVQTTATASNLASGSYNLTITDANLCTYKTSATITSPAALTVATTVTNTKCSASYDGTATATPAGGTGPYSYSWNSSPAQTTATATALPAGNYIVTVTDANACKNTGSATIASPAVLTAAATATNVSCNASSDGTATVTPSGGTGPYTYSWSTSPVQTAASISALPAGTYTVTVKDANNCSITASATVGAPLTLSASATATNITCGGTNGSVTASASGGTAPYSYSWNTSPVQTTATASGLGAGTYTVTVTDAKACIKTTSATVTSASGLTASVTTVNTKCNTSADGSATATVSGGTGPYSYSWNTSPIQTTATASNLASGSYNLTITDANLCTYNTSAVITSPSALTIAATPTHVLCYGQSTGTLALTSTGGTGPYSFSINNTTFVAGTPGASFNNLPAKSYTPLVKDSKGCQASVSIFITQPASAVTTSISVSDVKCNGDNTGQINVSANNGTGPYTYVLNNGVESLQNSFSGLTANKYNIQVYDNNRCRTIIDTAVKQPSLLVLTSVIQDVTCQNDATGSVSLSVAGGKKPFQIAFNNSAYASNQTFSNLTAGTYLASVRDSNSCQKDIPVIINTLHPLPVPIITPNSPIVFCVGSSVTLSTAPQSSYMWSNGKTTNSIVVSQAGTFSVQVTDKYSCKGKSAPVSVSVIPFPTANVGIDSTVTQCPGAELKLGSPAKDGNTYEWTSEPPYFKSNSANPVVNPLVTTLFKLKVSNTACYDTSYVTVKVSDPSSLFIPNAFSPNHDGKNDDFKVVSTGINQFKGSIFNRWGELIYEWQEVEKGWNGGRNNDIIAEADVYVYKIDATDKCNNNTISKTGTVTLVK